MVATARAMVTEAPTPAPAAGLPSPREIFQEYGPYIWRVLRRLGVPESDADDVCQEVFMAVHKQLASFEGRSSLRTWLYAIALRRASSYRRRAHRRHETTTATPPEQVVEDDPHRELEKRRARETLDRLLDTLDDKSREVFVLYEIEQLRMPEVAEVLGHPLQTCYGRLRQARRDLKAAAQELGGRA